MPIVITKRPAQPAATNRRQVLLDDMARRGSSCGSAFNMDDEIERFYGVWCEAGHPQNVWVGYMVEKGQRVVRIVQTTAEGATSVE